MRPSQVFRAGLLSGQVAIVTGGGSGTGRATALELASLGAKVVIFGRRLEPLEETARLASPGRIDTIGGDIRNAADVERLVDETLERHGQIDLLVNNAGGQFLAPAEQISLKGFQTVLRLNVEGTWHVTHTVATRAMIPQGRGGKIICVTISPPTGLPSMAHSSAARAAVDNLVRVLSTEWARFDIKLNAIALGSIATDVTFTKYPASVVESAAKGTPLQRSGRAQDMAWLVALLASCAGDFISGAVLNVDGGRSNWYGAWPPEAYRDADGNPLIEARGERS